MSVQQHHLPETLSYGNATNAHWATASPTHAILFVHGFYGHAVSTWIQFPEMLLADPRAAAADIIFYGYDGKHRQAGTSADEFLDFLITLADKPSTLSKGQGRSKNDAPYSRIVIVAHSLGGVITRRALLDAMTDEEPWLDRVRFVLFAPAHHGAYGAVLASAFASEQDWYLGKIAAKWAQYNTPLLMDLEPESSVLKSLIDDTQAALAKVAAQDPKARPAYLVANTVVWANDDKVVINKRFGKDPKPIRLQGDHSRICKPDLGYIDPIEIVLRELT